MTSVPQSTKIRTVIEALTKHFLDFSACKNYPDCNRNGWRCFAHFHPIMAYCVVHVHVHAEIFSNDFQVQCVSCERKAAAPHETVRE